VLREGHGSDVLEPILGEEVVEAVVARLSSLGYGRLCHSFLQETCLEGRLWPFEAELSLEGRELRVVISV